MGTEETYDEYKAYKHNAWLGCWYGDVCKDIWDHQQEKIDALRDELSGWEDEDTLRSEP